MLANHPMGLPGKHSMEVRRSMILNADSAGPMGMPGAPCACLHGAACMGEASAPGPAAACQAGSMRMAVAWLSTPTSLMPVGQQGSVSEVGALVRHCAPALWPEWLVGVEPGDFPRIGVRPVLEVNPELPELRCVCVMQGFPSLEPGQCRGVLFVAFVATI